MNHCHACLTKHKERVWASFGVNGDWLCHVHWLTSPHGTALQLSRRNQELEEEVNHELRPRPESCSDGSH